MTYNRPVDLLNHYRTLYVTVLNAHPLGPFAVSHYQAATQDPRSDQMLEKEEIVSKIYRALDRPSSSSRFIEVPAQWAILFPEMSIDKYDILHALNAGGSPEEIENALTAAVVAGHLPPQQGPIEAFMGKFIGLDCCGFVGNYFQLNHVRFGGPEDDPTPSARTPPNVYTGWGTTVKNRDDIRRNDILLFPIARKSTRHIALIDSALGDQFIVCESHGGCGPERRVYYLNGGPDPLSIGVILGTDQLPQSERVTFRFRHPEVGNINLMVRHVVN